MNSDLISRQDAINAIEDNLGDSVCERIATNILKGLPSAEKTGKWIGDKCSVCGEERAWYGCNPSYCPHCGSRMENGGEDDE